MDHIQLPSLTEVRLAWVRVTNIALFIFPPFLKGWYFTLCCLFVATWRNRLRVMSPWTPQDNRQKLHLPSLGHVGNWNNGKKQILYFQGTAKLNSDLSLTKISHQKGLAPHFVWIFASITPELFCLSSLALINHLWWTGENLNCQPICWLTNIWAVDMFQNK